MAMNFLHRHKDVEGVLSDQIQSLRDELRSLRKQASKRGSHSYNDARESAADLIEEISEALAPAVAQVRKQAHHAGETMRGHPAATAVVGVLVLGLIAAFFSSRSSSR